jgi:hypothetical protein
MRKSHGAMVMILARKARKQSDQARVEERLKAGKCLNVKLDEAGRMTDCDNAANASRGNCLACQHSYNERLKSLSPEDAIEFEELAARKGWRLRPHEVIKIKSKYAWDRLGKDAG